MSWASLLKRVLDVDALSCPKCMAPMVVLAFLTDPAVVERILTHLELPAVTVTPHLLPARRPMDQADLFPDDIVDSPVPDDPTGLIQDRSAWKRPRPARAPP